MHLYLRGFASEPKRNEPISVAAVNPLPENAKTSDTGDAGRDGYSVLSRADRMTGVRPLVGGTPVCQGPNFSQEQ